MVPSNVEGKGVHQGSTLGSPSHPENLKSHQILSQDIPKPRATPLPKETIRRIFGTSQTFWSFEEKRPKVNGLTVPLKVREYYHRGHWCLEREDWEMAVLFFSRAIHLDPQLVDFYALRAEAYIQLCDYSSAIQNLRRAYSFQPESTQLLKRLTLVLYLQGQCLFEQCSFLDALNVFSQAFELQPEKPCFRYRCMACLLALNRQEDCLSLVTKEVKHGTSNADIYILRARLYNFFGKANLCYQDLHSALLLDPKHPQARVLLRVMVGQAQKSYQDAKTLAVQGKLQHAVQCMNCAIENNPLDPGFFLFRGTIYRRLQEFDAAVEDFLKALDMMPDHQEDMVRQAQRQLLLAYNDFAVHCYTQGAYQESVLLLNKALKDEQQEKGLYINRGDCFFQLGYLHFAEADYQEALALSPQDEGAHLRMGLLQEKMGFCEHKGRQFQKAESHFSMAIQHNPQMAQYYVQRARSRQLLRNIFGARQDIATALLLDRKQPKLLPLMSNLFPGMSVEEVLSSQVALLAKMQLNRTMESRLQKSISQGILGQLRKRELERQKARALQLAWKQGQVLWEISEQLDTPETPEEEPKPTPEAVDAKKEEEPARSPSDSYVDPTSSGSFLDFRTLSASETEMSTAYPEYRSTSATTGMASESSLLKTQASDLGNHRKDRSLSHSPRKMQDSSGQNQKSSSKTEALQSQSPKPSMTEATQSPRQKPSKTKATQSPKQRLRKTKAAHRRSPMKAEATQGWSQGLMRSSSKTKTDNDPSWSLSNTETTKGQGQRPSKTEIAQSFPSPGTSKTYVIQDLSQSPSKIQVNKSLSKIQADQSPGKIQADQSLRKIQADQSLGKIQADQSLGKIQADQSLRKIQADQSLGKIQADQSLRKIQADQSLGKIQADQSLRKIQADQSLGKIQADQSLRKIQADQSLGKIQADQSLRKIQADQSLGKIQADQSLRKIQADQSLGKIQADQSLRKIQADQSPRKIQADQSLGKIQADQSLGKIQADKSLGKIQADQSLGKIQADQSLGKIQADKSLGKIQADQSLGKIQADQSLGKIQADQSLGKIQADQSPRKIQADQSLGKIQADQSPRKIQTDQSPGKIQADQSLRKIQADQSPKKIQTDQSPSPGSYPAL